MKSIHQKNVVNTTPNKFCSKAVGCCKILVYAPVPCSNQYSFKAWFINPFNMQIQLCFHMSDSMHNRLLVKYCYVYVYFITAYFCPCCILHGHHMKKGAIKLCFKAQNQPYSHDNCIYQHKAFEWKKQDRVCLVLQAHQATVLLDSLTPIVAIDIPHFTHRQLMLFWFHDFLLVVIHVLSKTELR